MHLQGRLCPGGHCCEGGILSESLWERLAQHTHLNCLLRFRLHQRTRQEESWVERCQSLIPENEKHPSSPPEAWDIKVFNEVFQRGSSSTMNIWRPLLGEFQCLWHLDYPQNLRYARGWVLQRACGKFRKAIVRTCSKGQGEIVISSDQGSKLPPTVLVKGRKGPRQDNSFLLWLEVKFSKP